MAKYSNTISEYNSYINKIKNLGFTDAQIKKHFGNELENLDDLEKCRDNLIKLCGKKDVGGMGIPVEKILELLREYNSIEEVYEEIEKAVDCSDLDIDLDPFLGIIWDCHGEFSSDPIQFINNIHLITSTYSFPIEDVLDCLGGGCSIGDILKGAGKAYDTQEILDYYGNLEQLDSSKYDWS